MYVETKGPTLEELARLFDGDDAKVAHVDIREVEKDMVMGREYEEEILQKK